MSEEANERRALTARWFVVVLVSLIATPFLVLGLGAPLDDPGEGQNAEIARELFERGNPFALTLNGVAYVDKPPLVFALQALAFRVGGVSETSARTVSAIAGLLAVAGTAWLGARLLSPLGGVIAGAALLTSPWFVVYARYVRPDALFVAAIAWGFALVLAGLDARRRALVGAGLIAFGIAGLAKDVAGTLAPPAAIALACALNGRARDFVRSVPWPAAAAALVLATAWWLGTELRTPGALWYTIVDNKLRNMAGVRLYPDEDVSLSAVEFLAVALLGAFPWTILAAFAAWHLVVRARWRRAEELPWLPLFVWTIGGLVVSTLSAFRLPHYGLPMYPALAVLAARGATTLGRRASFVAGAAFVTAGIVAFLMWRGDGAAFAHVIGVADGATRNVAELGGELYAPPWRRMQPLLGLGAVVLATGGGLALASAWRSTPPLAVVVALTMLALTPLTTRAAAMMAEHRSARPIARFVAEQAATSDLIGHEGPIETSGSFEWYSGRRPFIVNGRRSVVAFGAAQPEASPLFWDTERLRSVWTRKRVWLVTTRPPAHSVARSLPGARLVLQTGTRALYVSPAITAP